MYLCREAICLLELIPMPDMQADDRLLPAHGLFCPRKFALKPSAGLHHKAQELPSPPRRAVRWHADLCRAMWAACHGLVIRAVPNLFGDVLIFPGAAICRRQTAFK